MRTLVVRALGIVIAVLLLAGVGGYWYARPLLLTGTGYAAHNACALASIAGREEINADLPPNPLVPYLVINDEGADGEASVLGLLARQRAWYTEGVGCTLAPADPGWAALAPVDPGPNPLLDVAAPTGAGSVSASLGRAFGDDLDDLERERLGTRGVVVLHKGKLIAERYADGFTAKTPQLGWSMSKSVTNLLLGRLVQQGVVHPSDDDLRPEWADGRRAITIDQLSRMTSGLAWDETYDLGTPITRMLYLEPDMAAYVASLPSAHQPGSYQQYSSGSTNLLCKVLAERAGSVPGTALQRELFGKLGLSSAVWEPDATGTPVCSSYLWATPRDWAVLGQLALQDGVWNGEQLLPPGWMKQSTTVEAVSQTEDPGYAAGWWANRLPDGSLVRESLPADAYWASGHDGQRVYVVPSAELVVVRLGFSPDIESADLRIDPLVAELIAALR